MSADGQPIDTLRSYLRAWEDSNVEAMEQLLATGFTHEVNGRREDRAGLLTRVASADDVISERRFHLDSIVAHDGLVACRCRLTGRHTGPMPVGPPLRDHLGADQIEPTGREISMSGMILATIEDGRLVSGYGEWDRLGLLTQLMGPPSAPDVA